jgi:small subunit ribosomal protein S8e
MGTEKVQPVIGPTSRKVVSVMGNGTKAKILKENVINVTDPKTGKTQKTTITTEVENPANKNYVRRNILTKGAIVTTELGKAKITSRPGQQGELNGVILE